MARQLHFLKRHAIPKRFLKSKTTQQPRQSRLFWAPTTSPRIDPPSHQAHNPAACRHLTIRPQISMDRRSGSTHTYSHRGITAGAWNEHGTDWVINTRLFVPATAAPLCGRMAKHKPSRLLNGSDKSRTVLHLHWIITRRRRYWRTDDITGALASRRNGAETCVGLSYGAINANKQRRDEWGMRGSLEGEGLRSPVKSLTIDQREYVTCTLKS